MTPSSDETWSFQALQLVNKFVYRFVNIFSQARLKPALREAIAELEREPLPQSVLSVGAGGRLGEITQTFKNGTVLVVDIDPDRKPDLVADICDMKEVADNSFDAIFVMEVLEHVKEPGRALSELYRVLKPGGRMMASVPFVFEIHEAPHDYFRYTRFGLAHLCGQFEQVTIEPRNGYVFAVLVPAMRLIKSQYWSDIFIGWLCSFVVLVFLPAFWVLDRLVRSEAVTSGYIIRGAKPNQ